MNSQPEFKPLYMQIQQMLTHRVVTGDWGPGEMLPSEMRLAAEYNVHQGTIRRALDEMAARNLVVRQQGKGTFVAAVSMRHNPFRFFHLQPSDHSDTKPTAHFLSIKREAATKQAREMLKMEDDWFEVIRTLKLRCYDDKPVLVEDIVYPADLFPSLEILFKDLAPDKTAYGLLEQKYRILIERVTETLTAVPASAQVAKLLKIEKDTPLLRIDRLAFALDSRPVEWRTSYCSTKDHEYFVEHR